MSAHTPWVVESTNRLGPGAEYTQHTVQPNICEVFYFDKKGEDIARLIAAAPELLMALQVVRLSKGWQEMSIETQALIVSAIAKATGGDV